jgi:pimeloyl-ACP methyl ester carboxylesterase
MASQVDPAMARWVSHTTRTQKPHLVKRFSDMIEATPLEGYAGWCGAIEHLDMTDRLSGIKLPTRVIVGAEDPATPIAASETIQKNIPGADLIILSGVSHMLACEDPASFHAALLPFLAQHTR